MSIKPLVISVLPIILNFSAMSGREPPRYGHFSFASQAKAQECWCRQTEGGQTNEQDIGDVCAGRAYNRQPGLALAEHNIVFDSSSSLAIMFFKWGVGGFNQMCEIGFLFPEASAGCQSIWDAAGVYNGFQTGGITSQTMDGNAKYVVPYCIWMEKIYLYKIVGLGWENCFELNDVLDLPRPLESLRFFGNKAVVIDQEYITIYALEGNKLLKEADYYFPHPMAEYFVQDGQLKIYRAIQDFLLINDHLYLLLPWPMNGYGPLLTFIIDGKSIALLDNGTSFPVNPAVPSWEHLMTDNINGNIYLAYEEDKQYYYKIGSSGIPTFIFSVNFEPGFSVLGDDNWKSGNFYLKAPPPGFGNGCYSELLHFTEAGFSNTHLLSHGDEINISNTQAINGGSITIICTTGILPTINFVILPQSLTSGSFLVAGTASAPEGIRSVFSGSAWRPYLRRADVFRQPDGSAFWMAKMEDRLFVGTENFPLSPCSLGEVTLATVAEDTNRDSNMSIDNPPYQDMRCLKIDPNQNPMPTGEVEGRPCTYDSVLAFSGWAVDNSGIWQGWLFSEDAQVLIPITVGIERPDIAALYPNDPDSLHSGFTATTDTSAIPEGEYDFTVRLLANDYQVLDFGPYTIIVDHSHPRPLSMP